MPYTFDACSSPFTVQGKPAVSALNDDLLGGRKYADPGHTPCSFSDVKLGQELWSIANNVEWLQRAA
jgi:hypothetical protein